MRLSGDETCRTSYLSNLLFDSLAAAKYLQLEFHFRSPERGLHTDELEVFVG